MMIEKLFNLTGGRRKKQMRTILIMFTYFHKLIHERKPDIIDVGSKYELQKLGIDGVKGFQMKIKTAKEAEEGMKVMKDFGFNEGVGKCHDAICDDLSLMIVMMKPLVGEKVWKESLKSVDNMFQETKKEKVKSER